MHRSPTLDLQERRWLVAGVLVAGVLVTTAAILWLLNQAIASQTLAARQSLVEAYRGQLRFIARQIDSFWMARATELDGYTDEVPASFSRAVRDGRADSLLLLDPVGRVLYPETPGTPVTGARPRPSSEAAILARQLVQAGSIPAAWTTRRDAAGRLLQADAYLLALDSTSEHDPRRAALVDELTTLLNDYGAVDMPSAQRLALMRQLHEQVPAARLWTIDAERIAAAYLESEWPRPDLAGLRPTRANGLWQLTSSNGRAVALYTEETVHTIQHRLVDEHQSDMVRFAIFPPGEIAYEEAIALGAALPGWQASFTLLDVAALDQSARARTASTLWVAALAIGVVVLAAAGAGHSVRRQLRLTRLKTDLIAAVSHELRTPLTSMRVLVDGLLQDATLDPVKTREYLNLISAENSRLSRLIESFLTFSRLERNRYRFTFSPTPPADVVHAAVEAMRERLHDGCAIDVQVAPSLPLIRADAEALVTALVNLLDNAQKYSGPDKQIAVCVTVEGRDVVFAVTDNGIGIPAREQRRIFRRFYRVDQRLARETDGVGLGLSIVHEIVRAHGGSVGVASGDGTGSTFTVRVPAAEAPR